eukprot:COSAG01_NODE_7529_length_3165_cov_3.172864_2_plen_110_part_00
MGSKAGLILPGVNSTFCSGDAPGAGGGGPGGLGGPSQPRAPTQVDELQQASSDLNGPGGPGEKTSVHMLEPGTVVLSHLYVALPEGGVGGGGEGEGEGGGWCPHASVQL